MASSPGSEKGTALIELSIGLVLLFFVGYGLYGLSKYVSSKMYAANITGYVAYRMRVVCEIYPPVFLNDCMQDIIEQVEPIISDTGYDMTLRLSVFEKNGPGIAIAESLAVPAGGMASEITAGYFVTGEPNEVINMVERAYTVEARFEPFAAIPFFGAWSLYDIAIA